MRRTFRKKKWKPDKSQYRANQNIRVPEVQVIDDEGKLLGIMPTKQAIEQANESGFDLVEVNPKAIPPLVKYLDFGKVQFEREKLKQKQKAKLKKIETKGIRISFKISEHDRQVRITQAKKFFGKGHKVKIELVLRGRENKYIKQAVEMVQKFITDLKTEMTDIELFAESAPKKEGHRITALISIKTTK